MDINSLSPSLLTSSPRSNPNRGEVAAEAVRNAVTQSQETPERAPAEAASRSDNPPASRVEPNLETTDLNQLLLRNSGTDALESGETGTRQRAEGQAEQSQTQAQVDSRRTRLQDQLQAIANNDAPPANIETSA